MQAIIQEDMPIVWIHESQVKEIKANKKKLDDNDIVFVLNLKKDYYNNFKALFVEPADKNLKQPSVSYVRLFKYVKDKRIATQSLDIKDKKVMQRLGLQVLKKKNICREKQQYLNLI